MENSDFNVERLNIIETLLWFNYWVEIINESFQNCNAESNAAKAETVMIVLSYKWV